MQLKEHTSTKWKEIKIKLPNSIYLSVHSAMLLPSETQFLYCNQL